MTPEQADAVVGLDHRGIVSALDAVTRALAPLRCNDQRERVLLAAAALFGIIRPTPPISEVQR